MGVTEYGLVVGLFGSVQTDGGELGFIQADEGRAEDGGEGDILLGIFQQLKQAEHVLDFGGDEETAGKFGMNRNLHLMEDFAPDFGAHFHGAEENHDIAIGNGPQLFGVGIDDIEFGLAVGVIGADDLPDATSDDDGFTTSGIQFDTVIITILALSSIIFFYRIIEIAFDEVEFDSRWNFGIGG